jgi:hypothetical protein
MVAPGQACLVAGRVASFRHATPFPAQPGYARILNGNASRLSDSAPGSEPRLGGMSRAGCSPGQRRSFRILARASSKMRCSSSMGVRRCMTEPSQKYVSVMDKLSSWWIKRRTVRFLIFSLSRFQQEDQKMQCRKNNAGQSNYPALKISKWAYINGWSFQLAKITQFLAKSIPPILRWRACSRFRYSGAERLFSGAPKLFPRQELSLPRRMTPSMRGNSCLSSKPGRVL